MSPPEESSKSYTHRILFEQKLHALKKFGQNFLINDEIIKKIIILSNISKTDTVVEIGPGTGSLTREILKHTPNRLIIIEKDLRFKPALDDLIRKNQGASVHFQDAMRTNWTELLQSGSPEGHEVKLLSNLPYNIGTAIMLEITTRHYSLFSSICFMLQKEVVERVTAVPKTKSYGSLSVLMQLLFTAQKHFDVEKGNFIPPPNVQSSILTLSPKYSETEVFQNIDLISHVVQTLFHNRRKTLRHAIMSLFKYYKIKDTPEESIFQGLVRLRAEEIPVAEYKHICLKFKEKYLQTDRLGKI